MAKKKKTTKTLKISFEVPLEGDWPSERVNQAKEMLLEALASAKAEGWFNASSGSPLYKEDWDIATALLTES